MSSQWNQQLRRYTFSKKIKCLEQNNFENNWLQKTIEYQTKKQYKIFKLKYGNAELLWNTKSNQVELGLAVFASAFCTKLAYIKGALSGLRQFLAIENPLKIMKSAFYFTSKALFILKMFKFLTFWLCSKTTQLER